MRTEIITYTDEGLRHPPEDAFKVSKKYPIFAVADGVTLMDRDKNGSYPTPSGAKQVADAFCQNSVKWIEKNYQNLNIKIMKEAFKSANKVIEEINDKAGRTKETINFFDFDFFHATGALAVIKENQLFYGRIHDCWITALDKNDKIKLSLIEPWDWECGKRALARRPKNWKSLCVKEKTVYSHKYERNRIWDNDELAGYGVLTGEEAVLRYLETGSLDLEKGDIILVYTDGFEEYIKLKKFLEIFTNWKKHGKAKTEASLRRFSKTKGEENWLKFGTERTLIAVKYG